MRNDKDLQKKLILALSRSKVNRSGGKVVAAATGAAGGAGTCAVIGKAGLAIAGTGISIGFIPFAIVGAICGLAAYSLFE